MSPNTDATRLDTQFVEDTLRRLKRLEQEQDVFTDIDLRHEARLRDLERRHTVVLQRYMAVVDDLMRDRRRAAAVLGLVALGLVSLVAFLVWVAVRIF